MTVGIKVDKVDPLYSRMSKEYSNPSPVIRFPNAIVVTKILCLAGFRKTSIEPVTLNLPGYGIDYIIEVLKHALNEFNSSKYDVEAAKCKKLLNKIADKW